MKLGQLIELLQGYVEEFGDEAEVKIAEQESYPFEYTLKGACSREDVVRTDGEWDETGEKGDQWQNELREHEGDKDVILVAGRQLGYGRRSSWEVAREW